jgi:electron transfer flavoprotein alpha subunit
MQQVLVLLDTNDEMATEQNLKVISCAQQICAVIGANYSLLLDAHDTVCSEVKRWLNYGATTVLVADIGFPNNSTTEVVENVLQVAHSGGAVHLVAPGTAHWIELLQKLSATAQWQLVENVTHVEMTGTGALFHGPWVAGQPVVGRRLTSSSAIFAPTAGAYQPACTTAAQSSIRYIRIAKP